MAEGVPSYPMLNEGGKDISSNMAKRPYTTRQKRPIDELGHSSKVVIAKKTRGESKDLFSAMNLDSLFNLCCIMYPLDLLHLSRASKAFRRYLMSKSSAPIWKAARLQLPGMPECPPELSEPQYASFLFEHHCHGCGGSADKVFWKFRARYCKSCIKLYTLDGEQLPEMVSKLISGFHCIPTEGGRWSKALYHRRDVIAFKEKVSNMSLPDINKHMEECHHLALVIEKHAKLCEKWCLSFHCGPKYSEAEIKGWTKDWMINCGWEAEVNYFDFGMLTQDVGMQMIPLIESRRQRFRDNRLNGRMLRWRNVRIEETIYTPRRQVLIASYKKYLRSSMGTNYGYDIMPHVADVSAFQPFDDIIKSPPEVMVDALSFAAAFAQLPTFASQWRRNIDKELSELYERSRLNSAIFAGPSKDHAALLARLRLASTVFIPSPQYSHKRDMLLYPDMLAYHDFVKPFRPHSPNAECIMEKTLGGRAWNLNGFKSDSNGSIKSFPIVEVFKQAADIIRACGKDPGIATVDDMNAFDPWLRCDGCLVSQGKKLVMSWRTAIYHAIQFHLVDPHFTLLSYEDNCRIRRTKAVFNEDHINHICKLCRRSVSDAMQKSELVTHLQVEHQIPEAKIKRELHYMPDPNSAPTIISPVWLKPGAVRAPANGLPGRLPFPSYTSMFSTPVGPVVSANHFMPQTSSSQSYFLGPTPGISDSWMHQIPKLLPTTPSTNSMPLTVSWDMIYAATNASLPSSSYNDANIGSTDFTAQAPDSDQHQPEGGQA